jgi:hypothetical protein
LVGCRGGRLPTRLSRHFPFVRYRAELEDQAPPEYLSLFVCSTVPIPFPRAIFSKTPNYTYKRGRSTSDVHFPCIFSTTLCLLLARFQSTAFWTFSDAILLIEKTNKSFEATHIVHKYLALNHAPWRKKFHRLPPATPHFTMPPTPPIHPMSSMRPSAITPLVSGWHLTMQT